MLPIALALAPAAIQLGMGIYQNSQANRMKAERPQYQIPGAALEQVEMARQAAGSTRMPGQSYEEDNIRSAQAAGIRSAAMAGGPNYLAAVAAMARGTQNSFNQLGARGQAFQQQSRMQLMRSLSDLSRMQERQWDYNHRQKFMEDAAAKSAMKGAGLQNMYGALSGVSQAGTMAMMYGSGAKTGNPAGVTPPVPTASSNPYMPTGGGNYASGANYGLRGLPGGYMGMIDPATGLPYQ